MYRLLQMHGRLKEKIGRLIMKAVKLFQYVQSIYQAALDHLLGEPIEEEEDDAAETTATLTTLGGA